MPIARLWPSGGRLVGLHHFLDPGLFAAFGRWTAAVLAARHVPVESLLHALDVLRAEVRDFPRTTAMLVEAHEAVRTSQGGAGE